MKADAANKVCKWSLYAILVTGLAYSALTLSIKPVYASSCDCNEAADDANQYCMLRGAPAPYVQSFSCPTGSAQDHFSGKCTDGSQFNFPCSF